MAGNSYTIDLLVFGAFLLVLALGRPVLHVGVHRGKHVVQIAQLGHLPVDQPRLVDENA